MGTVKKLVLASLVGSMMVLTFAIGLFPTPASLEVSAQSGGRVDLLDFFSKALGLDKQVGSITITFPADGSSVKVLSNSTAAVIPIQAEVTPEGTGHLVTIGIDGDISAPFEWTGTVVSNTVTEAPYVAQVDLIDLGASLVGAHRMYGLAENVNKATVIYDFIDVIDFSIDELDPLVVDVNGDGLLDNPFAVLGPGEIYLATIEVEVPPGSGIFETKHIVMADLDIFQIGSKIEGALGTITVPIVAGGLSFVIESASLSDFIPPTNINGNDVIPAGEQAVLIVVVAPSIESLVGATQAANAPAPPNTLAFGTQFVEISIIYSTDGGVGDTFTEIHELPESLPVRLTINNVDAAVDEPAGAGVWSLNTDVESGTVIAIPVDGEWDKRAGGTLDLINASLDIYLDHLSIFGALDSAMVITSATPAFGFPAGGEIVTLAGTFPVAADIYTIAQAAAAYSVYFGAPSAATLAAFDMSVSPSDAIATATTMRVVAPERLDITSNILVDIWLYDKVSPTDFTSLANGFGYVVTPSITDIMLDIGPLAGGDSVTITGDNLTTATVASFGANDVSIDPVNVTHTSITLLTPPGDAVGAVSVTVTTDGGTSNALTYTYAALPTITDFSPTSAPADVSTAVTITGTNLDNVVSVTIAGLAPASFTSDSSTQITAMTASNAVPGSGPIVVTTPGGTATSATDFTYEEAAATELTVTGVSPSTGWIFGGAIVSIAGTGFTNGVGVPTVDFDGVAASVIEATDTELFVLVPASAVSIGLAGDGMSAVDITVDRVDLKSSATLTAGFTYHSFVKSGGVTTTAMTLSGGVGTIDMRLDADVSFNSASNVASLSIPSASGVADRQVLAMAFNSQTLFTLPGEIHGTVIPGSWSLSVHLYEDDPVFTNTGPVITNTPTLTAGQSALTEVTSTYAWVPGMPARLDAPTSTATLTTADVRTGRVVAVNRQNGAGSLPTSLDYATPSATPVLDVGIHSVLSSQMLAMNTVGDPVTEFVDVGFLGLGTMELLQDADMAHFHGESLINFTLQAIRMGENVPVDIDETTILNSGDTIVVTSDRGGLGYIASGNARAAGAPKGTTPPEFDLAVVTGTGDGEDAFTVSLTIPTDLRGVEGAVDLGILLPGDTPDAPTYTVTLAFQLPPVTVPPRFPLLLALLAFLLLGGGDGGGGGPCFIATAAYGTPMAAEIETLRAVRDTYLLDNAVGTMLVDSYYRVSPAIADVVAQSPVLAAVVRLLLLPVVFLSKLALASPALTALFALMGGTLIVGRRRAKKNRA